jgi:hypothetical protein
VQREEAEKLPKVLVVKVDLVIEMTSAREISRAEATKPAVERRGQTTKSCGCP